MVNEKLQKAAHRFAALTKELSDAKRRVSEAQTRLANLQNERGALVVEMREYVGANRPHRLEATPAGTVTISYIAGTNPEVRVFGPDGEEIQT